MSRAAHDATFLFEYADERAARTVARAVGNEVGEIDDDRSRATLDREGRRVEVRIEAADLVALRAASNTWLGLVDVAERTLGVADARERDAGENGRRTTDARERDAEDSET